jgi:hypothetical protein
MAGIRIKVTTPAVGDVFGALGGEGPVTEAQVVLAFLRGQINSSRWGGHYRAYLQHHRLSRRQLIDRADITDPAQNSERMKLLRAASGKIFRGFPGRITWIRRMIEASELGHLKYAKAEPWMELSGGTRWVADGARNLDTVPAGNDRFNVSAHVRAVIEALRTGKIFPELILVEGDSGDLILLEGHARATAYVADGIKAPVAAYIGSSPKMRQWLFY